LGLSLATRPWLLAVGAACVLAGWLYTGGPRPYGYLGLGEAFVFLFFGLVATTGTAFVQELRLTPLALLSAIPMGSIASGVLVLNNLRDIDTDRAAGKMTLAVRTGRRGSRALLLALLAAAFLTPWVVVAAGMAGPAALLPWLSLPLAVAAYRASARRDGPSLVMGLRRAAALELAFAILWAIGLLA
ncbi:MAG: 1,4-dihydroxy-2-naphthoate octaprenyltransferase, partial [Candidatus Dormibacteraceae bacterium]